MRIPKVVPTPSSALPRDSDTYLLPLGETALRASAYLKSHGLYVPAIRPPTVPPNAARLRLTLMSTHTDAHIEKLLTTLAAFQVKASSAPR